MVVVKWYHMTLPTSRRGFDSRLPHMQVDRVFNDLQMEYVTFVTLSDDELKCMRHEAGLAIAYGLDLPTLDEFLDLS